MANPSKQKGTAAESAVRDLALVHGIPAERCAPHGNQDVGDLWLWSGLVVVEVKAYKDHPSWGDVDKWWQELKAEVERVDCCHLGALVIKRPGSGLGNAMDWFAWVTLADLAWWLVRGRDVTLASKVGMKLPQQRVMMPLGDLFVLLRKGADDAGY